MSDKTGISERDITISEPTNFRHNKPDLTKNGPEIRLTPLDVQPAPKEIGKESLDTEPESASNSSQAKDKASETDTSEPKVTIES